MDEKEREGVAHEWSEEEEELDIEIEDTDDIARRKMVRPVSPATNLLALCWRTARSPLQSFNHSPRAAACGVFARSPLQTFSRCTARVALTAWSTTSIRRPT
jgi:hypothetical protein